MTQSAAIEIEQLTKHFGEVVALDGLSLNVRAGEIFGFLGPNGAGKTTAIRILLDLIRPTSGSARIFGTSCRHVEAVHRQIGYLPGEMSLYTNYSAKRLIDVFGNLRQNQIDPAYVQELSDRLEVQPDKPVGELSHGNRQKVGLVIALMAQPDLLILDEPTAGLDPLMQTEVLTILHEIRDAGRTVFFSSHNLPEVERICDRIAIIRKGRLVEVESIEELKTRQTHNLHFTFAEPIPSERFASIKGVQVLETQEDGRRMQISVTGEMDAVLKAAAEYHCVSLISDQPSLEEEFLSLYGRGETER